jgi:hypothetical protein
MDLRNLWTNFKWLSIAAFCPPLSMKLLDSRLVFNSKVPNFVYQMISRLGVVRDSPHILKRHIFKKSVELF